MAEEKQLTSILDMFIRPTHKGKASRPSVQEPQHRDMPRQVVQEVKAQRSVIMEETDDDESSLPSNGNAGRRTVSSNADRKGEMTPSHSSVNSVGKEPPLLGRPQPSIRETLPELQGWLYKKSPTFPYRWQKRWCVAMDSYVLWSTQRVEIQDATSARERMKFNKCISMIMITEVRKKERDQFLFIGKDQTKRKLRTFEWKTKTQGDRDKWVQGLKQHIDYVRQMMDFE